MNFVEAGFVHSGYFIRDSDTSGGFRFDGFGKKIFVNDGVTSVSIPDMYSRWCDWLTREDNAKFSQAMRVSGYDPIPGGFTGATFFMTNGWRVVYDPNLTAINGVLYSDVDGTPYWSSTGNQIYPATVSALVNTALTTGGGATAAEIAAAVLAALQATPVPVNLTQIKGQTLNGSGSALDPWGP